MTSLGSSPSTYPRLNRCKAVFVACFFVASAILIVSILLSLKLTEKGRINGLSPIGHPEKVRPKFSVKVPDERAKRVRRQVMYDTE